MRSDGIRESLRTRLFPEGVPLLWCLPLTHYTRQGGIDGARIQAHLRHLSPHAKGLLVPGSTGDGWELDPEESRQVLDLALEQARQLHSENLWTRRAEVARWLPGSEKMH